MNDEITEINSYLSATHLENNPSFYCNLQKEEWISLAFTITTCIGVIFSSCFPLINKPQDFNSVTFSLVLVLLVNCVFLVYYMLNGIINEKEYDLYLGYIATFTFIISICIYEFGYHYGSQSYNLINLIRLLVCFSACPISIYLILKIAEDISWTEFKIVGASEVFQYIYRQSGYFISLLKVDFQLCICVLLLEFRKGPYNASSFSTTLVLILLPLSLVISIIGYKAMRRESIRLSVLFILCQVILPVFIFYQLYQIYSMPSQDKINDYIIVYPLLVFDAMSLISKGILVYETTFVMKNFDQGLKERAFALETDSDMQPLLYKVRRRKLKIRYCCC